MIYLILHIVLSSCFLIIVRWAQNRKHNIVNVGAVNYITCAVIAVFLFLLKPPSNYSGISFLLGAINGVCYINVFFITIFILPWKGAALTSAVARLAMILPLLAGIIFWGERPTSVQFVGIALACLSLILIGQREVGIAGTKVPPIIAVIMTVAFLIEGSALTSQEAFKYLGSPDEITLYILTAFIIAGTISIIILISRHQRPSIPEMIIGGVLGIVNNVQLVFLLKALESLPGFIIFPAASAGSLLITTCLAGLFLKERLVSLTYTIIVISIVSLVLLNL